MAKQYVHIYSCMLSKFVYGACLLQYLLLEAKQNVTPPGCPAVLKKVFTGVASARVVAKF